MLARRPDLLQTDASLREQTVLDSVLKKESSAKRESVPRVSISEARHGAAQVAVSSERDTTRLLFISRDTSLLNQTTQSLDGYLNLSDVFDEVHIVVLQTGSTPRNPVLRVSANVWLYVVTAPQWWLTPIAAVELIQSQLVFADGFRPDLIVARDPYESALIARYLGRHLGRPIQIHVLEDVFEKKVRANLPHAFWRFLITRYVLPRCASVRTTTDQMTQKLAARYPQIPDIETLPRFHNYQSVLMSPPNYTLKNKYPQYAFHILYIGTLDNDARAYQAMDAVRGLLRSKTVCLVFCGDGSGRPELQKRAEILGIAEQVVFERDLDTVSCLAGANVLIVPEVTNGGDDVAILGAFAKVPLVLTVTPQRADLFVHSQSALLCREGDTTAMGQAVSQIMSAPSLADSFVEAAYEVVTSRFHEDPIAYLVAYRDSVEAALFVLEDDDDNNGATDSESVTLQEDKV
jgi:glycosyltransferase involved in cell wall biosynthesis